MEMESETSWYFGIGNKNDMDMLKYKMSMRDILESIYYIKKKKKKLKYCKPYMKYLQNKKNWNISDDILDLQTNI